VQQRYANTPTASGIHVFDDSAEILAVAATKASRRFDVHDVDVEEREGELVPS
jgi:hypothetical protein